MDKRQIIEKMSAVKTKTELLQLLNELKTEDLGTDAYPFELKQLNFYCNPNNTQGRYAEFDIPKKSGGVRHISAPRRGLMSLLTYAKMVLEAYYTPDSAAMGFTAGRSIVTNAQCHVNQNYVLKLDLKDFFPSVHQARIWKRLQLKPFCFSQDIANVIAGLCCMKVLEQDGTSKYVLPQGAPTSPLLTNAICESMDKKLRGLARRFGLNYSRYADDITFSSKHNVYAANGDFWKELKRIIAEQHFEINEKKTRLQKIGKHQEVTGLVVSDRVNVSRKYVRELRSILYMWERYGYQNAYTRFYGHYKQEKGYIKKGEPCMENVLVGKLEYLKMVKGAKNSTYLSLRQRLDSLCAVAFPQEMAKENEMLFLMLYSFAGFNKQFATEIVFTEDQKGKWRASCVVNGVTLDLYVSKGAYELVKKKAYKQLYVALCEQRQRHFWLVMPFTSQPVRSEQYALTIDKLLNAWDKNGIANAADEYANNSPAIENVDIDAILDVWESQGLDVAMQGKTNNDKQSVKIDSLDLSDIIMMPEDMDWYEF